MARTLLWSVPVPRDPSPSASCTDARELCERIYEWTGLGWLAEGSYYLLVKPLRILLIILLAVAARYLIHRLIARVVRQATTTSPGLAALRRVRLPRARLPRPLRDPAAAAASAAAAATGAATGAVAPTERRRARAEALGSILRSIASTAVFVIAVMLVLAEIGLNLAPLLAGAGIVGLAVGFGAQNLVRDFLSGLFMLFEDQYGVGDVVDVGEVTGTVEAVGLRITTMRDPQGVLWYIRNGEIIRVGNKSQGWALVMVDVPIGFTSVEEAADVLRTAAADLAADEDWKDDIVEPPQVLGVEQITTEGAVLRTTVKTPPDAQWRVGRELRRRLTEALHTTGIAARISAGRMYVRGPENGNGGGESAPAGPT
jgi:moderate conductance mechanosensitive channel